VYEAEDMVHRRGDVVRRRQAAPLLHLQRHRISQTDEKGTSCANAMAGQGIGEPAARQKTTRA
jgi:hypothetical protein